MKVVHSRDVVFDETSTPGIQKEKDTTVKYVELEVEEDSDEKETLTSESTDSVSEDMTVHEKSSEESVSPDRIASESVPRRSTRNKQKPDRYSYNITATVASIDQDPCSVSEARSAPDKDEWERAMNMEMDSLHANEVWELVEPPADRKVVGSKWIFKRKVDADGTVERYKSRLVAQGCTQRFGLDYEETFSPVVRFESIRSMVALGA